jgi:leucyl aminopeptidase
MTMTASAFKLIPASFTPIPSHAATPVALSAVEQPSADVDAVGYAVTSDGDVPASLGLDRDALSAAGFEGKAGESLVLVQPNAAAIVAVGVGAADEQTEAGIRDAAANFARAAKHYAKLAFVVGASEVEPERLGQLVAEGATLARYRYTELKSEPKVTSLESLELVVSSDDIVAATDGLRRGGILARAANLARDLANTPPGHLTATDLGDVATALGAEYGLDVEVFDKQQLIDLGCGGLLGVNAGSAEEPRMIQIRYTPASVDGSAPRGHLAFVGKGITYDSGGISLKPSDAMHLLMKMDMAGAGAALSAMTTLGELGCDNAVTAFLMCTDNMPSGSATKLGDVLTIHGGTTVEVKNTDAEGRLVMSDALALASEESPDAIIDIATLTGAALVALGPSTAALLGNDQELVDRILAASKVTDESLWQLPLEKRYRKLLDSEVADIANIGGPYAGATTAALFLSEFVGDTPWAHLDIAGTMQVDADDSWRSKGATGFGTRTLIELALSFEPAAG